MKIPKKSVGFGSIKCKGKCGAKISKTGLRPFHPVEERHPGYEIQIVFKPGFLFLE